MKVAIALGSNLGDRLANLRFGRDEMLRLTDLTGAAVSPVYETPPVDCPPGSGDFLNGVILGDTELAPEEWLDLLLAIEEEAGRVRRGEVNSPRPLDLDLLFCGDERRTSPRLLLPHPCLPVRKFVLQPLHDLAPDLVVPGHSVTVATLLARCPSTEPPPKLLHREW